MPVYLLKRLAAAALMAAAATVVVFLIAHFVPGDPIQAILGERQAQDPAIVAAYRARWNLDAPIWQQFLTYASGVLHGDLGISIATRRPVMDDILSFLPATAELATAAALLAFSVGIPLGVLAAVRRDSWVDNLARLVSLIGVSVPTFWLAFIVLAFFYGGLRIAPAPGRLDAGQLAPAFVTGSYVIDSILAGNWTLLGSALAHLVLPAVVLAAATLGLITRTTRASMLEALGQDYVRTARAKGIRERAVIVRHALRNSLIPVVTLGGVAYASLLSGAVMTETIFSWPGIGLYAFQSAVSLDFPAITGLTLVVSLIYLLVNLLVDLSYGLLDPRAVRR